MHSYYIRTLLGPRPAPLLLIPKIEVEGFFQEVRDKTGIYLPFPDVTTTPGFDIGFQLEGEPRPRYLGRLAHNVAVSELQDMIPAEGMVPEERLELDNRSLPAFRKKMEFAVLAGKNNAQGQKERKKRERVVQMGRWCAQLKRTQCYLGLRPKVNAKLEDFDTDPNATWEESQAAEEAYKVAVGILLPPVDFNKPARYLFNLNVIFISVDIEAYERDPKKLTEVGISTLDTLDIVKTPPGEGGVEWTRQIRCRHFRIADHAHLTNEDFVRGCPDDFRLEFGTSEWISANKIPQVVAGCFRAPYSAPGQYERYPTKLSDCATYGPRIEPLVNSENCPKRNIILVGHGVKSDITYLRSIGYDVSNLGNLLEAVDTIDLWRAWKHEQQAPKLGHILFELEVDGWHLHNAVWTFFARYINHDQRLNMQQGNDAAYTMQALVGIALAALDPAKKAPASLPTELLNEAALEARQHLGEAEAQWADADEEGGDGGEAVSVSQLEFDQSMSKGRKADERALKRNQNKSRQSKGYETSAARSASARGKGHGEVAAHRDTNATKPTGYVLPHMRGLPRPVESEPKSKPSDKAIGTKPNGKLPQLSQQMQKRLVIMDDEEYGV